MLLVLVRWLVSLPVSSLRGFQSIKMEIYLFIFLEISDFIAPASCHWGMKRQRKLFLKYCTWSQRRRLQS